MEESRSMFQLSLQVSKAIARAAEGVQLSRMSDVEEAK
jgi:hypothetical protein